MPNSCIHLIEAFSPAIAVVLWLPASYFIGISSGINWFADSIPVPPIIIGSNFWGNELMNPEIPSGPYKVLCPAKTI